MSQISYPCKSGDLYRVELRLENSILQLLNNTIFKDSVYKNVYKCVDINRVFTTSIEDSSVSNLDYNIFHESDYSYIINTIHNFFYDELIIVYTDNDIPPKQTPFMVIMPEMKNCCNEFLKEEQLIGYNEWIQRLNSIQGRILTLLEAYIADKEQRKAIKDILKGKFSEYYTEANDCLIN